MTCWVLGEVKEEIKMTIKFGIIGFGHRGREFFFDSLLPNKSIEVVMIADSNPLNLNNLEDNRIQTTTDYHEILSNELIEGIFIATPDDTHGEITLAAIRHNKHIILEKPLEISVDKVVQLEKALGGYQRVFIVAYVLRYAPLFVKAKELVESGAIGEVFLINATDHIDYGSYAFFRDWHRLKEKSGSLLLQKASHSLDMINWLIDSEPFQVAGLGGLESFGSPGAIKKFGQPLTEKRYCHSCPIEESCEESLLNLKRYKKMEWGKDWPDQCVFDDEINVQDHQALLILYKNRAKVTYNLCQFSAFYRREFQLFGTKGELYFDDESHQIIVSNRQTGKREKYEFGDKLKHSGGDSEIVAEFVRCVEGYGISRSSVKSSASVTKLVLAAQEAIDHNKICFIE